MAKRILVLKNSPYEDGVLLIMPNSNRIRHVTDPEFFKMVKEETGVDIGELPDCKLPRSVFLQDADDIFAAETAKIKLDAAQHYIGV